MLHNASKLQPANDQSIDVAVPQASTDDAACAVTRLCNTFMMTLRHGNARQLCCRSARLASRLQQLHALNKCVGACGDVTVGVRRGGCRMLGEVDVYTRVGEQLLLQSSPSAVRTESPARYVLECDNMSVSLQA